MKMFKGINYKTRIIYGNVTFFSKFRILIIKILNYLIGFVGYPYFKIIKRNKTFRFQSQNYKYCTDFYNNSWRNERTVEIPIMVNYLEQFRDKNILEIGNVLSNYIKINHTVIDKFDNCNGVIHKDINEYNPVNKYDLIISISTFEHIGYDEKILHSKKTLLVYNKIKNWIKPNGMIVLTVPYGYNDYLDKIIISGELKVSEKYFLKRISSNNNWNEVKNIGEISDCLYGETYPGASGIVILIFKNN